MSDEGSGSAANETASVQATNVQSTEPAADPIGSVVTQAADEPLHYPDGVHLDSAVKDSFEALKAGKISHQAFLDGFFAQAKSISDKAKADADAARQATEKAWADEMAKDGKFGGARLQESAAAADRALKHLSPDGALAKVLSDAGLQKNPAVLRAFAQIGFGLAEDSVAGTATSDSAPRTREDFLRLMYQQ